MRNRFRIAHLSIVSACVSFSVASARADDAPVREVPERSPAPAGSATEVDATSPLDASLVLAAPEPTVAASMLGHVYLAFGARDARTGEPDPLGVSFEFAATTSGASAASVVWNGLTGGFPMVLRQYPNWQVANRYRVREGRDLWIFPLRLSRDQRVLLGATLADARTASRDYLFVSNNCATEMARAFDAVLPRDPDSDHSLTAGIVSPASLVSALVDARVTSGPAAFLPSSTRAFDVAMRTLSPRDRESVNRKLESAGEDGSEEGETAFALCAALDAGLRVREQAGDPEVRLAAARLARKLSGSCVAHSGSNGDLPSGIGTTTTIDPSRAHGPARVEVGALWPFDAESDAAVVVSARAGLHELGEPRISDYDYVGASYFDASAAIGANGRTRLLAATAVRLEQLAFGPGSTFGTASRVTVAFDNVGETGAAVLPAGTAGVGAAFGFASRTGGHTGIETVGYALAAGAAGVHVEDGRSAGQVAPVVGVLARFFDLLTLRTELVGVPKLRAPALASPSISVHSAVRVSQRFGFLVDARLRDGSSSVGASTVFWFP